MVDDAVGVEDYQKHRFWTEGSQRRLPGAAPWASRSATSHGLELSFARRDPRQSRPCRRAPTERSPSESWPSAL